MCRAVAKRKPSATERPAPLTCNARRVIAGDGRVRTIGGPGSGQCKYVHLPEALGLTWRVVGIILSWLARTPAAEPHRGEVSLSDHDAEWLAVNAADQPVSPHGGPDESELQAVADGETRFSMEETGLSAGNPFQPSEMAASPSFAVSERATPETGPSSGAGETTEGRFESGQGGDVGQGAGDAVLQTTPISDLNTGQLEQSVADQFSYDAQHASSPDDYKQEQESVLDFLKHMDSDRNDAMSSFVENMRE